MHTLYILSVYVHILSAIIWIGGMFFLVLVVVPWLRSYGKVIVAKLIAFTIVLVLSAIHDFVLGPRAIVALASSPDAVASLRIRKRASLLGRLNAVMALVVVLLAVLIVRGVP
jgi:copper resistance protein D